MDKIPIPKTKWGWFCCITLIIISFALYYGYLYPSLERTYYAHYWHRPAYTSSDSIQVNVFTPKFIYSFVEREIKIQVKNTDPIASYDVDVLIFLDQPPEDQLIIFCPSQSLSTIGCDYGSSAILFGVIPPRSTVTKNVWVSAKPIPQDVPGKKFVLFQYYRRVKDGNPERIPFRGKTRAEISIVPSLAQSFISAILLPPWANGVLPALALLVTWFFEEGLKVPLFFPPRKMDTDSKQKGTRVKVLINAIPICIRDFFSILRSIVKNKFIWGWLISYFGLLLVLVFLPQVVLDFSDDISFGWFHFWNLLLLVIGGFLLFCGIVKSTYLAVWIHEGSPRGFRKKEYNDQSLSESDANDIQFLLEYPSTAPHVLKALQKYHARLPEMERYFSLLKEPDWLRDSELDKSVKESSSHDLKACVNPAFIRRLLKLYESSDKRLKLKTADDVCLADAMVLAGKDLIDEALEEVLVDGKEKLVSKILTALQNSNRPVMDLIRFFRFVVQPTKNDLNVMLSTLAKSRRELPKYHQEIKDLLTSNTQQSKSAFIKGLETEDDKKDFLDIGRYISAHNHEFADWFVYEELIHVRDSLVKQFLPILKEVTRGLNVRWPMKRRPEISDRFKQLLEHNWSKPKIEKLLKQPREFINALGRALDDQSVAVGDPNSTN